MSTSKTACQRCEAPVSAAGPAGLCPACLMSEAIDSLETVPDHSTAPREAPASHPLLPDPLEGTTLGPDDRYKLLQRLGEGGFGTVYMAEQSKPVRRRVAIKVLKAGMDTRQVVARFEAERQALAMMDHPCIAKVLDGGETEQGWPFFVMELVRGTPITEFCDREELPTKARLALFLQVCGAVQHAHQKGIIHRDLKPGNILVTVQDGAEPVPKVIDFGVAKAMESNLTDKTLFTRFEQMIGTPAYMSPEQAGTDAAANDIDTRADIYALGVLLYELLTGTTPFDSRTLQHAAFDEVRRILREEEAPRPSARLGSLELNRRTTIAKDRGTEAAGLGKLLRGDLDWIVMKAIEKDRRRRYETASAFALDLEKHLQNEPVGASPPTAAYRAGKFLRKHRVGVGIAAIVFISLAGGLALALTGFARAKEQARKAMEAEQIAEAERETADLINEFLLEDLLGQADSAGAALDSEFTMRDALDRAAATLDERFADRPRTRAEIHALVGRAYELIGSPESALRHSQEHRELIEREFGVQSAAALRAQAHGAQILGETDGARILRQVLAAQRDLLGDAHPDTLATMASLSARTDETQEGIDLARERLGLLQAHFPDDLMSIATARLLLGQSLKKNGTGHRDEAITVLQAAVADFEDLPDNAEARILLQQSKEWIGYIRKDSKAVFTSLRETLREAQRSHGSESVDAAPHYFQLGWTLGQVGTYEEALEGVALLEKALELAKRHRPSDLAGRAYYEVCLKACQDRVGLRQEAIDLLRGTLQEIRESGFTGAQGKYQEATYLDRLHSFYYRHVDLNGAEEVFRPAVETAISSEGFAEATASGFYPLLAKAAFVNGGEEGLKALLRELGALSDPPLAEDDLAGYFEEGVRKGTLHSALIAARQGKWDTARERFERHRDLGGEWDGRNTFLGYGALVFALGDHDAHRAYCAAAMERYADSDDLAELDLTAILLLLDPAEDNRELHLTGSALARKSLELDQAEKGHKGFNNRNVLARGLAALRTGGWDEEIEKQLKGAVQLLQPKIQSPIHSCLAIAAARRGEGEVAAEHLAQAEELIDEWTFWKDRWPEKWIYQLVAEALLEEAQAVVAP